MPLLNARIPELPANAAIKAKYLLALYNDDNDTTERFALGELMASTTTGNFEFASNTTYLNNEVVTYGGKWWQAQQNVPINILPGSDATYWAEVSKSNSGFVFWQAGVYPQDVVLVLKDTSVAQDNSEIGIYYLVDSTRPFVSSNFTTELAANKWALIRGSSNTFSNGLNETSGLVKLGGTLTENTDLSGAIDWTQYGLNFWQVQTVVDAMTASYILGSGGASIYVQKNAASPGTPATLQIDIQTDNPSITTSVIITPASVYFKTALFELDGDALNVSTNNSVATKAYVDSMAGGSGLTMATWSFPSGVFPTDPSKLYIATVAHGSPGDSDFVDVNTWFIANTPTPTTYSHFNYK